jgi:GNAT superfamily N-acetyltransferase
MPTIRPTHPDDVPLLLKITRDTAVFKSIEVEILQQLFDDYFAENDVPGHRCVTCLHDGQVAGFAYFGPEKMTESSWCLYWIVIQRAQQSRGWGGELLSYVESEIRKTGPAVLFVETSSLPHYEPTRRFYLKHEYLQEAILRDYYAPGDDKVIFRKAL